jgi:outer membrane protein assembly factor BamA
MRIASAASAGEPSGDVMIGEKKAPSSISAFAAVGILILLIVFGWKTLFAQDSITAPVRIDRVVVMGNKVTAQDVILREIPFDFPAVLSADELKLIQNRVQNLRLFNRVELRVDECKGQNVLTILVTESWYIFPSPVVFASERDWSKISYGLELTDNNFRGRNEKLRVGGWLGYNPSYFLNYSIPWIGERQRLMLGVSISKGQTDNKVFGFQEDRLGFNVRVGKRLSLKLETDVQFSLNRLKLPPEYRSFSVSGSGQDIVPSLSWQVRWENRDLTEYPRKGTYLAVNIEKTGFAKGQPDYWRMSFDGRFYERVLGSISFAARQFFVLNNGNMPVYARVYLGFNERVRGYYNLILPDPARYADYNSYNISLSSLEFRFTILPVRYFSIENGPLIPSLFRNLKFGLSAGFFVDNAIVWRNAGDIRLSDFYTGYGLGIHIILPYINVFRIEYALNKTGLGQFIFETGVSF